MSRGYKAGVRGGGGIIPPGPVVPDGKTVTPINDIPTWLKCAGIPTTTYTTLSEVLADTSLLRMLINSENAMDYLVRCKEWIKQKALVPTMTSATTPSGVVTQSSIYNNNNGFAGWRAFNGILVGGSGAIWHSEASSNSWIQYEFPTNCKIKLIKIWDRNSDNIQGTYNVNFKRSSDGEVIKSFSYSPTNNGVHEIVVDNDNNGNICRLEYTNPASPNNYTIIAELQFYGEQGVTDNSTAMQLIGANDYASNLLLADEDWCEAIDNSTYSGYLLTPKVPTMTSDTTPSGTVIHSTPYSTMYAWYVFNNPESTTSISNDHIFYDNSSAEKYVGYDFGNDTKLYSMHAKVGHLAGTVTITNTYKLQYSNDGATWIDINNSEFTVTTTNTSSSITLSDLQRKYFSINSPKIRLLVSVYTNAGIGYLQFYGRANGGVQSWLLSAGITNKAYTSLSEVFSDTETLRALLNNHDAVYYLTTVPGWATEFAANENAMKYIGANDYASDVLLANEDWLNAIINSTYYAEILNAAVPTMTSNTTPEGECFGDGTFQSSWEGYKAFDDNTGTWSKFSTSTTVHAIGYDFGYNAAVFKAVIRPYYSFTSAKIQTSSDNTTWIDASAAIAVTQDVDNIISGNNYAKNRYWRLYLTNSSASNFTIREIQFYGRVTGGVQSWLLVAGITNKNYTTVSQVLADSDLLPVLIASHSGMDYLATCVAFANEICANETAMQLIGADNYAADALLSNSTWLNAICNSTHVERVLNVKVPVMTSDSLPSGTCAADSINSAESASFKAFDNDATTFWSSNPTGTPGQHYNGYTFTAPQKIKMVELTSFKNAQSSSDFEIKISSHDGGVWTDVSESFTFANTADSTTRKFAFVNDTAYSNYAVRFPVDCTAFSGQYIAQARTIQFYGREDV